MRANSGPSKHRSWSGVCAWREEARHCAAARGVEELLTLRDCDGLATEIYFGPQIEIRNPLMPTQPVSGFKTGDLGLGHIVLTVTNTSATEAFYRDFLGFRTTDYINLELAPGVATKAVFMRCNARHHSIALVAAPLPKRLLHFMAEVEKLDEVGLALERAHLSGVRIAATLGRHSNDRIVFTTWRVRRASRSSTAAPAG